MEESKSRELTSKPFIYIAAHALAIAAFLYSVIVIPVGYLVNSHCFSTGFNLCSIVGGLMCAMLAFPTIFVALSVPEMTRRRAAYLFLLAAIALGISILTPTIRSMTCVGY